MSLTSGLLPNLNGPPPTFPSPRDPGSLFSPSYALSVSLAVLVPASSLWSPQGYAPSAPSPLTSAPTIRSALSSLPPLRCPQPLSFATPFLIVMDRCVFPPPTALLPNLPPVLPSFNTAPFAASRPYPPPLATSRFHNLAQERSPHTTLLSPPKTASTLPPFLPVAVEPPLRHSLRRILVWSAICLHLFFADRPGNYHSQGIGHLRPGHRPKILSLLPFLVRATSPSVLVLPLWCVHTSEASALVRPCRSTRSKPEDQKPPCRMPRPAPTPALFSPTLGHPRLDFFLTTLHLLLVPDPLAHF